MKKPWEGISVFILCGGKGTRLRRSGHTPKVLAPVHGRPILFHVTQHFYSQGVREFILGTGYLSEKVEAFVREEMNPADFTISNAGADASMLERLYHARSYFKETVIVAYGDTFIDFQYKDLIEQHRGSGCPMTILTGQIRNPFGVVQIGDQNRVTSFVEKPVCDYYIGCLAFSRILLDRITSSLLQLPDGEGLVALFNLLAQRGELQAFRHKGLQITFNTEEELQAADQVLKDYFTVREN